MNTAADAAGDEEEGGGDGRAGDQGLVGGDAMRGLGAGTWRIGNFSSSLKSTAAHAALLRSIIYSKCNDDERGIVQQLLAKGDGDLKKVAKAIKKQRKGWGDGGDGLATLTRPAEEYCAEERDDDTIVGRCEAVTCHAATAQGEIDPKSRSELMLAALRAWLNVPESIISDDELQEANADWNYVLLAFVYLTATATSPHRNHLEAELGMLRGCRHHWGQMKQKIDTGAGTVGDSGKTDPANLPREMQQMATRVARLTQDVRERIESMHEGARQWQELQRRATVELVGELASRARGEPGALTAAANDAAKKAYSNLEKNKVWQLFEARRRKKHCGLRLRCECAPALRNISSTAAGLLLLYAFAFRLSTGRRGSTR